jgi:subtilisin family serine protease
MRKAFFLILVFILLVPFFSSRQGALAAGPIDRPVDPKIAPQLKADLLNLKPGEMTTVIVTLVQQADLSAIRSPSRPARQRDSVRLLLATADTSQRPIKDFLQAQRLLGGLGNVTSFWIFNGLSVTATPQVINELAARPDVLSITPDLIQVMPAALPSAITPEANLSVINVPALWGKGYYGQGVVVANMDTGVDVSHPDLAAHWRGGSNSWYDPYGQHPATPTDLSGHGTNTMGVMVGDSSGGTAIGVAPQARWVAVKIFNDSGSATATAIHQGYQWLLDPDGNPLTADAPQVVNNSWTFSSPGCNLEFQLDLQALRSGGVLPVFAAGNFGPLASTSASPANYPESFAVGAVDNTDLIDASSSRGPTTCGQAQAIYPALVAPGVNIYSSDMFGLYSINSGTSLSAPHVSSALALLLNAYPGLNVIQQKSALINGAVDLGPAGADNDFGYGRLDTLASFQWLQANGATPQLAGLHVGDLDKVAKTSKLKKGWDVTITIRIHDANEEPIIGATVFGAWTAGISGGTSCITDVHGACTISAYKIGIKRPSVTINVADVTFAGYQYLASANHDPEADSNGTTIVVLRP